MKNDSLKLQTSGMPVKMEKKNKKTTSVHTQTDTRENKNYLNWWKKTFRVG